MGVVFEKGGVNQSIRSLNTVSENTNLYANKKAVEVSNLSSFKTAAESSKKVNKKPIKFSDSYFIKFLESMDDNGRSDGLKDDG